MHKANVKKELYFCYYATKSDIKEAKEVDTSKESFTKKNDLISSKSAAEEIDLNKPQKMSADLNTLKLDVCKLDKNKLKTVSLDLKINC